MSRKKKHPEHENLERWLVSYADFITLLFAFFTVLYALSQADKAKYKTAVENIQRSFLTGGGVFPLRGSAFNPFDKPPDRGAQTPASPSDEGKFATVERTTEIADEVKNLFEKTTGGITTQQISTVKSDLGYKIRLDEVILFRAGSDKIRPESIPFLYELGKRLAKTGLAIQIEGHSDIMASQSEKNNWELSMNRAFNILSFLVSATGFPSNKISMAAYGDSQPLAANDTPEGRAKNRRVEISVISPDREITTLPW